MKALYQLSNKIAGFDFYAWLVMQAQASATEIVFDTRNPTTGKWPLETVMRRFESILWPGPALLGLKASLGTEGAQLAPYHQRDLIRLSRAGVKFPRLKSVLPPGKERYTVTLRNSQRGPDRNSNEAEWRAFAAEIGAIVIPDYDDVPIHLHERMALYAGAEMNFFCANGPSLLCNLSEYPAMVFDCQNSTLTSCGLPLGEKYPFCLPQHFMVYKPPDMQTVRHCFSEWLAGRLT